MSGNFYILGKIKSVFIDRIELLHLKLFELCMSGLYSVGIHSPSQQIQSGTTVNFQQSFFFLLLFLLSFFFFTVK